MPTVPPTSSQRAISPASPASSLSPQRSSGGHSASDWPPHVPRLALNREGDIQQFNGAARRVLEYGPEETPKQSFFSYVDGRNLQRVMWDLARMVNNRVKKARWLLRLSTGRSRWRWYRVAAQSKLRSEGVIELTVRPLETRHTGR